MHIKVRGGTVASGEPSLCATCRYATVIKGRNLREEIVECCQLADGHGRITFPVTHCTALATIGMLDQPFTKRIAVCAGLRNRITHEYDAIDPRACTRRYGPPCGTFPNT